MGHPVGCTSRVAGIGCWCCSAEGEAWEGAAAGRPLCQAVWFLENLLSHLFSTSVLSTYSRVPVSLSGPGCFRDKLMQICSQAFVVEPGEGSLVIQDEAVD